MKTNALVPEFEVKNIEKSLEFYVKILGFKIEFERPASKFAYLSLGESQLMLCEIDAKGDWHTGEMDYPLGRGMHLQIVVQDVVKIFKRLQELNIKIFKGPYQVWYPVAENKLSGTIEFLIQDPDGYLLRLQENIGYKDNTNNMEVSERKTFEIS